MKIFTKFGDFIIRLFDFVGMLIFSILEIPKYLRDVNTNNIKGRIDAEGIKENISKIKEDSRIKESISKISRAEATETKGSELVDKSKVIVERTETEHFLGKFSSEEKERTILQLQILSGAFLVISILYIFNFLSFSIYGILGVLLVAYFLHLLFNKVKLMYSEDFSAYRDFFLMYIAAGIILVLISYNQDLLTAFSFSFLPSASILIFAVILVAAIFLIFRIRYHRNYTYGRVIEAGKNTAYVKVDYDIRSNVKPDIYLVENKVNAAEEDKVKLQIDEKLFSTGGNKPVHVIEII